MTINDIMRIYIGNTKKKIGTLTGSEILFQCQSVKVRHSMRVVPVSDFGIG